MTYLVIPERLVGRRLSDIVDSWSSCDGAEEAESLANRLRSTETVKIFKLVEVGHYSKRGNKRG